MKKAALPAALMLVAAGIVGGIVAFMGSEVRLADKAPRNTTLWFEAQNLKASWKHFKNSDAFEDFKRSKSYLELNRTRKRLLELAATDRHLKRVQELGLAFNEANLLNFLGQNVAVGVIAGDGSHAPITYGMTRIDVLGLAKEIAVEGNWREVWSKLQDMLAGEDSTKSEYKGYGIASRSFPVPTKSKTYTIHFSMVEDMLVVSDTKSAVEAVIDVHKGDAPSLGSLPKFDDEVDALERNKIAYAWADVELIRDKARVKKIVQAAGKTISEETGDKGVLKLAEKFTGDELDVLIEDLHPDVAGLAVGLHAPGVNPYRAHFAGSRPTEEVFKDSKHVDVRTIAGDDTMFLFETKNLFDLVVRFVNSKTALKLQQTEAWQWAREKLEDPGQLAGVGPGVPVKESPLFELRTGLAASQALLKELLGESLAVVIGTVKADKIEDAIRPALYYRPRPFLRMAADLALGFAAVHGELSKTKRVDQGGYPVFQIKPDKKMPTIHVARIGADFLITTQEAIVKDSVAKAGKKGEFASESIRATLGKIPSGYQALFYIDYSRYGALFETMLKGMGPQPKGQNPKAAIDLINKIYGPAAQAFYVSEDFTSWRFQAYQGHAPGGDERFKKLYLNAEKQPGLWKHMPESTFGSMVWRLDPVSLYDYFFDMGRSLVPKEEFDRGHEELKEQLGKDPRELLDLIGQEMGLAVIAQDKLVPEGAPAEQAKMILAVPALVAYVELKDASKFQKELVPLLEKLLEKANAARAGGSKEAQVIAALKTISNAQALYREADKDGDGKLFYAKRLRDLGKQDLIDSMLASGFHHGYRFRLQRTPKDGGEFTWMCTASPFMGEEGRHFAINHEGTVYHALKKFELTETCTLPKDAIPVGKPLPGMKPKKKDPNDPNSIRLVETKAGAATVWEVKLPEKDARQLGMVGEGVKPCFAINGTHLILSSSRAALDQALGAASGKNLTANPSFQKAIKGQETAVAMFMHLTAEGVIEQIKRNSRFMALQAASPSSKELKKPEMPEWDRKQSPKDYDAKFEQYRKDRAKYREAVAKWRKDKADENAAAIERILDSLNALGRMVMWARNTKDDTAIESFAEWKLEPSLVKAPEKKE